MKKSLFLGLALILLLSLVVAIVPPLAQASPEVDAWKRYPIPLKGKASGWVLTGSGTGVTAIGVAFDGTIYAGTEETAGSPLYGYNLFKSTDDGYTWTPLWKIPAGDKPPGGPVSDPNSKIIALVLPRWEYTDILYLATQYNVYKSTDGGKNFTILGARPTYGSGATLTNNRLITSLDVTYYNGNYLTVVGSRDVDTAAGDYGGVYIYDESKIFTPWVDLRVGNAPAGTKYDVLGVTLSPNFANDWQVVALVTDDVAGSLTTKVTTQLAGSDWDATISDVTLGVWAASGGSLVFPADYDSDISKDKYIQYVGLDAGANSTVYMVMGAEKPNMSMAVPMFVPDATKAVHSMAIAGEAFGATIVAGLKSGSVLYSDASGVFWQESYTPPSVAATASDTYVALGGFYTSGYVVYAGTSGTNGGFARSVDSGATFAQTAFINDDLLSIIDLAVSPNYANDSTMYMITVGNFGNSILWRTADSGATWDAVLTAGQVITLTSGTAVPVGNFDKVAISPFFASDTTVFIRELGAAPNIWRSTDNGFRFSPLPSKTGTTVSIESWAIVGNRKLFVSDSLGNFYKTTNGGLTWSPAVSTGLSGFSSMALSPDYDNDHTLLVGGATTVYLSTDDGETWRQPSTAATGLTGAISVAFDPYYADSGIIYAAGATAGGIRRLVMGGNEPWQRIDNINPSRIENTPTISALVVGDDGNGLSTIYGTDSRSVVTRVVTAGGGTAAEGGMARCLNPTDVLSPVTSAPVFEIVNTDLVAGITLSGLWHAEGPHTLWSIDTNPTPDVLYTY